jgi:hypothetical protein
MMKKIFFILFVFLSPVILLAQKQFEQTVRGVVTEKNTQELLHGAVVTVSARGKEFTTSSNDKGEFVISDIPVGRCNITVSMLGFSSYISNSILVYSGKETVLEIALEEKILILEEVSVNPKVDKELPLNQMAVVSARMLSSEEANRYAGTLANDLARMVSGFAGVIAANDTRNDIIIRGNSPAGLLWRLDGFDIPNPNHFAALGGTGGPIGMLNNNQLANSDFYTGAFPAEFGNVNSGVFDLRLRNGNKRKHEFLASIGMNGLEFGAEGPLSKKTGASYMINARYSFLDLLIQLMKTLSVFSETAVPKYEDVCAKINMPTKKGNLSVVALFGANRINFKPELSDSYDWVEGEKTEANNMKNWQLFTGINYTHRFNTSTRLENRLSYQWFQQSMNEDQYEYPAWNVIRNFFVLKDREDRIAYNSILNHRINIKNLIRTGIGADFFMTNIYTRFNQIVKNDYTGYSGLLKIFVQWQHRFSNNVSMISGVYTHYYTLNNDYSIEPRLGFKWQATPITSFSLGSGLHSQLQPRQVYMYEKESVVQNKNLKMNKSWHTVLGYNQNLGKSMHLKTELYYQWLFNIPVIPNVPEESILNFGDDFTNSWNYTFVNKGTGHNYGIEITVEKFFNKNYYFLVTASLYDSKYKGYDKIERRTKFAGNYAFNALFGYEWKLGKRILFSANTKVAYVGGKRYVPLTIDVANPDLPEFDYTQAYRKKLPDYFRWDLNVNMKVNFKKWAFELFFDVNNITNHRNIYQKYYNANRNKEEYVYQYALTPIGGCRIYFDAVKRDKKTPKKM